MSATRPVVGAGHPAVQCLQLLPSESTWNPDVTNARSIEELQKNPTTHTHANGMLIIDETGDREDGTHTAHVSRQYLGSVSKIDPPGMQVDGFMAVSAFQDRMDQVIDQIHDPRRAPGSDQIFVPGDSEYEKSRQRCAAGILLEEEMLSDLNRLAKETCTPVL